jgi:acylphosphatase
MEKEEEADRERTAFRIHGRVQGVGFRWWTQRTACALGLGGWVRNEPDGSVVVHAVGPAAALGRMEKALHRGPAMARVDRVESIRPDGALGPGEFRIEV